MTINLSTPDPVMVERDGELVTAEKPTVVLFTLDGTEYRVPAVPKASILLRYLWESKQDEVRASGNLLEDLLGPEGYLALMNYDALTPDDLKAILAAAAQLLVGEGPKG